MANGNGSKFINMLPKLWPIGVVIVSVAIALGGDRNTLSAHGAQIAKNTVEIESNEKRLDTLEKDVAVNQQFLEDIKEIVTEIKGDVKHHMRENGD